MKINSLMTLSQFVDYLSTEYPLQNGESELLECADNFKAIKKYNDFLKQPLKKEMFVNQISKPKKAHFITMGHDYHRLDSSAYQLSLIIWQEAEKKVIFEDGRADKNQSLTKIYVGDLKVAHHWENTFNLFLIYDTLHDLAEATSGELKLKNLNYEQIRQNNQ